MTIEEITKYIESPVEPKMSEAQSRMERLTAEAVRGIWEIALQLAKLNDKYWVMNRAELTGRSDV